MGGLINTMAGAAFAMSAAMNTSAALADEHSGDLTLSLPTAVAPPSVLASPVAAIENPGIQLSEEFIVYENSEFSPKFDPSGNYFVKNYGLKKKDSRRAPYISEIAYNSIVEIKTPGSSCTGAYATIEGVETRETGSIYITSAHCIIRKSSNGDYAGRYDPSDIKIYGSYFNSNTKNIEQFNTSGEGIWIDPRYLEQIFARRYMDENNLGDYYYKPPTADVAIIFSRETPPPQIVPLPFATMDYMGIHSLNARLLGKKINGQPILAELPGFSDDYSYLTNETPLLNADYNSDFRKLIVHSTFGASGAPLIVPGSLLQRKEDTAIAVKQAIDKSGTGYFDPINPNALVTASFLKAAGSDSNKECFTKGIVTATELNVRLGPMTGFDPVAPPGDRDNAYLLQGSEIFVLGVEPNEFGTSWLFVASPEVGFGYVSPYYVDINKEQKCFNRNPKPSYPALIH